MRHRLPTLIVLLAAAGTALLGCASRAAKPPPLYPGVSGIRWTQDFGIHKGHCDRAAISTRTVNYTLLGAEDRDNRGAAMLIGATIDDLVAGKLGYDLDGGDRACLGEVLEIGRAGRRVMWDNLATGVHYEVTPAREHEEIGGLCRRFKLLAVANTGKSKRHATACEKGAGLWQLSNASRL
ncbi:MAG TPA: RT0821/Lpp0805 family surface protein [Steroidobacteraceae bacterium]|nr:RT0821/Lpp0805 family surface protein [Steroidobacteraceae bacterium]